MTTPRKIIVSVPARADLRDIADYIGAASPQTAKRFVDALEGRFLKVATFPSAYPAREDLAPQLRMAVHHRYLILFREIAPNSIRIERILHTARDLRRLF